MTTMELEECIKDGFDDSLREYIQSEEYVSAKQHERRCLAYLESLLNESQKNALYSFWMKQLIQAAGFYPRHICMELLRV